MALPPFLASAAYPDMDDWNQLANGYEIHQKWDSTSKTAAKTLKCSAQDLDRFLPKENWDV
jgi:hypothetical protein